MNLSLTIDHEALDGAPAARFLKDLCTALENFELLWPGKADIFSHRGGAFVAEKGAPETRPTLFSRSYSGGAKVLNMQTFRRE